MCQMQQACAEESRPQALCTTQKFQVGRSCGFSSGHWKLDVIHQRNGDRSQEMEEAWESKMCPLPPDFPSTPPPSSARPSGSPVTSAAWSGCQSCSALSAGDCPAGAALPLETARPPPLCAEWLSSCFVR